VRAGPQFLHDRRNPSQFPKVLGCPTGITTRRGNARRKPMAVKVNRQAFVFRF
jgi:hypothetical protein